MLCGGQTGEGEGQLKQLRFELQSIDNGLRHAVGGVDTVQARFVAQQGERSQSEEGVEDVGNVARAVAESAGFVILEDNYMG